MSHPQATIPPQSTEAPAQTLPKPVPPQRRLLPATDEVAARSGVTVQTRTHHGVIFWCAVQTRGRRTVKQASGSLPVQDAGANWGVLHEQVERTVRRVRAHAQDPIYVSSSQTLADALHRRGLPASSTYPPAVGMKATTAGLEQAAHRFFRTVTLSTDASRGHTSRYVGTGWVIDFGAGSSPVVGARADVAGSILAAELKAMLHGLRAAHRALPHEDLRRCRFILRSDSQLALRMITEPGWAPPQASSQARGLVLQVRDLAGVCDVDFQWVKSHAGDPGNETADRLAVLARRTVEWGGTALGLAGAVEAVRAEVHQDWSQRAHALAA